MADGLNSASNGYKNDSCAFVCMDCGGQRVDIMQLFGRCSDFCDKYELELQIESHLVRMYWKLTVTYCITYTVFVMNAGA